MGVSCLNNEVVYSVLELKEHWLPYLSLQADLNVYKVKYTNQANENKGLWYFVNYSNLADKKIYFVDYPNQAGWRSKVKNI